ncbi:trimeric autotransporter adhesin [Hydromonas duriensis]|uniref:Trimeric autotransporter adhesin n=2 Tax=Hydromonas duriensis TaxID=1527608 RepID=A0A4R6Y9U8_9BURK|nr:trimeric autotransporter adhesin [Hydromonas duriensis]
MNEQGTKYFQVNSSESDTVESLKNSSEAGSVASGKNAIAIGANSLASGENAIAQGNHATASGVDSMALGTNSSASASNSVAIGANSSATAVNSVALGSGSVSDRDNAVSVGSAGNERQITNVAAGTAPTDAVNVSQLQGLSSTVDSKINALDDKLSAGVASAIALQAPALVVPGKTTVRAGVGYFRGQSALGVSMRQTAETGRWSLTGGVSASQKGGVAAGAAIEWVVGD